MNDKTDKTYAEIARELHITKAEAKHRLILSVIKEQVSGRVETEGYSEGWPNPPKTRNPSLLPDQETIDRETLDKIRTVPPKDCGTCNKKSDCKNKCRGPHRRQQRRLSWEIKEKGRHKSNPDRHGDTSLVYLMCDEAKKHINQGFVGKLKLGDIGLSFQSTQPEGKLDEVWYSSLEGLYQDQYLKWEDFKSLARTQPIFKRRKRFWFLWCQGFEAKEIALVTKVATAKVRGEIRAIKKALGIKPKPRKKALNPDNIKLAVDGDVYKVIVRLVSSESLCNFVCYETRNEYLANEIFRIKRKWYKWGEEIPYDRFKLPPLWAIEVWDSEDISSKIKTIDRTYGTNFWHQYKNAIECKSYPIHSLPIISQQEWKESLTVNLTSRKAFVDGNLSNSPGQGGYDYGNGNYTKQAVYGSLV